MPLPQTPQNIELTIGMATYNDFDGVYFTVQHLRMFHDLANTEILVVDNYGCEHTRSFIEGLASQAVRYVRYDGITGTAAPRNAVFNEAQGAAVLCCDSHVLFAPGVTQRLKEFYTENPDCMDLLQGPLLHDDLASVSTHFDQKWNDRMWGVWGQDARGEDPKGPPFEISMQGMGAFSCRKDAWPGFHLKFRGFGGEEGYIHEKFRQAGHHCLCLPWFRWIHRFSRPNGVPYPVVLEDRIRNYALGFLELDLDIQPLIEHFASFVPRQDVQNIVINAVEEF